MVNIKKYFEVHDEASEPQNNSAATPMCTDKQEQHKLVTVAASEVRPTLDICEQRIPTLTWCIKDGGQSQVLQGSKYLVLALVDFLVTSWLSPLKTIYIVMEVYFALL